MLAPPGGRGRLSREGDPLIAEDGRRFAIDRRIVRMLDGVDEGLAAELAVQEAALDIYLDQRQFLTQYDRTVMTPLAIEQMLGPFSGEALDAGCGVGTRRHSAESGRLSGVHSREYGLQT